MPIGIMMEGHGKRRHWYAKNTLDAIADVQALFPGTKIQDMAPNSFKDCEHGERYFHVVCARPDYCGVETTECRCGDGVPRDGLPADGPTSERIRFCDGAMPSVSDWTLLHEIATYDSHNAYIKRIQWKRFADGPKSSWSWKSFEDGPKPSWSRDKYWAPIHEEGSSRSFTYSNGLSVTRRNNEREKEWDEALDALRIESVNHVDQEFMASLIFNAVEKALESRRMALSASDYENDDPLLQEYYKELRKPAYEALAILDRLPHYVDDKRPNQHILRELIELIRACAEWAVAWDENHQAKTDEQRFRSQVKAANTKQQREWRRTYYAERHEHARQPLKKNSSEKVFQNWVITRAEERGWLVAHVADARSYGARSMAGWPDLALVSPYEQATYLVELKGNRTRVQNNQKIWLKQSGGMVWRPKQEDMVIAFLDGDNDTSKFDDPKNGIEEFEIGEGFMPNGLSRAWFGLKSDDTDRPREELP